MQQSIPSTQTVAVVNRLGGDVTFRGDYPVPTPTASEVLAKVLYTGVCQSDLHTARGTAAGPDGRPITNIKLPHIGGHEGVGRIVAVGSDIASSDPHVRVGALVGIRFSSRVCHRCEYCLAGTEQYCPSATNHLHHEDGSFQQYCVLDATYLTLLPDDVDPVTAGPALCAGVTSYRAVLNTNIRPGQWLIVVGAGGGLGHFAVQYARAIGARVLGIDSGNKKRERVLAAGAERFLDFREVADPIAAATQLTEGGAHGVVVTTGNSKAYAQAAEMLRVGGTLSCVGIPPDRAFFQTPVATFVIKGLKVSGNLVGSMKENLEALDFVRRGIVKPYVVVRPFKDLPKVYEELENDQVAGRVVLKVAEDDDSKPEVIRARL